MTATFGRGDRVVSRLVHGDTFAMPAIGRSDHGPRDLCSVRGRLATPTRPCPWCRRWVPLRLDYRVRVHGPRRARCPGSGDRPASPWTTARPHGRYL